ncbi:epidermal growth factor-like protein 8, partial [Caerostris extrusa]
RHVCSQNKVTMVPVRDMQSYCKPAYQSYLRRCDKDSSRYCSGLSTSFRIAQFKDWLQRLNLCNHVVQDGLSQEYQLTTAKKAICREECQNGGTCTKPDHCSCPSGWTGKTCSSDIDECSRRKGHCDHECVNTAGSFRCLCKAGFTLREDGKTCEKINTTRKERELDAEIITKLEVMQKRLDALEEWQNQMLKREKDEARHQRDDQINSLSDQIAILEERLEECSCNKRDILNFSRIQK